MVLEFTVTVTLNKTEGKFVSKADLCEQIRDALETADPGSVEVEDSTYDVESWDVGGEF